MIANTEKMSNFTFKMDDKTRKDYSELCNSFGLSIPDYQYRIKEAEH